MSTAIKSIIAIIIIAAAGAALWWSGWLSNLGINFPQTQPTATTTPQQQNEQPTVINDLPTQLNDFSDDALAKDVAALDVQIGGTAGDVGQVDKGLSDKPVAQEY